MPYRIEWRPAAARAFRKLPPPVQKRIGARVEALALSPRPSDAAKLAGEKNLWRVRVGRYRILYRPEDALLLVLVVEVGHRREVYRLMEPAPRLTILPEDEQDRFDAEEADRILSEARPEDFVPWEKVKTDLKL